MAKGRAALILLIPLLGCAEAPRPEGGTASSAQGLRVEDARVVLLPGGMDGVAYLKVVNGAEASDRLRSIESPSVQDIQTHESLDEGGVVRMRARPDGFEVPAGGELVLKEGGKHLMLMGIADSLPAGQTMLLKLHFDQAGMLEVEVPVQTIGN